MSKFSDYLASQITPQMTLLEKFNLMIKFLQENNYISVFYSQENYNLQTESYQKEKVNLNGFTLHIGDCIVFSNGYYAFVETIGVNNFTIGNVLYFQGEQGVSVVGATISSGNLILTLSDGENINAGNTGAISHFSIDESQHLIVHYQNGTTDDLGDIFQGNVSISGSLVVSNGISGNLTGDVTGNVTGNVNGDTEFENIKDSNGHNRFIEGNISFPTITGVEFTYGKWSLSGSHLMIVLAGNAAEGASFSGYASIVSFSNIPLWIMNKIYPVFGANYIEVKTFDMYNEDWSKETNPIRIGLSKSGSSMALSNFGSTYTTTKDRGFRFCFDLLIDND